jgi:hypothetical protein
MLPKADNFPPLPAQESECPLIARAILLNFHLPESGERVAPHGKPEAVPEITVDKDDDASPPEDKVGLSSQISCILLEPEAVTLEFSGERELQRRAARPNCRHASPALLRRQVIHAA